MSTTNERLIMQTSTNLILGGLLLYGCAHQGAVPTEDAAAAKVPLVNIREYEVRRDGTQQTQPPGSDLRRSEDFAIRLAPEGPVYIYAVKTAGGVSQLLDPSSPDSSRQYPAGTRRLPEGDKWLRVDDLPPKARVCLLMSVQPLKREQLTCKSGGTRGPDDQQPPPVEQPREPSQPEPAAPGPDEPRGGRIGAITETPLYFAQ